VTQLRQGDRTFYLVGTAHVSRRSVQEVRRVIEHLRPDTVCVELCQTRFEALTDRERWRKLDIFQVIRQRKMLFLVANLALQTFQRRLGERLGVRPGEELLMAVSTAKSVGAEVVLADRDVQATLRRTWANLSFWNKSKLLGGLLATVLDRQEIDEEQVEALKDRDHISDMLKELAAAMPEVKEPLIDERDRYLMSAIEDAPGKTVVAVVGAGHVEGMVQQQGKAADREALSRIPPPSRLGTAIKWLVPLVILAAFYWGYRQHAGEGLKDMLVAWIIPTAVGGGVGTLLGGGRLLSVLSAALSSPITTLNPTIGVGMVVGLTEAYLRRPRVEDCERLSDDITTLRGVWRNPFSRILLVALTSSLGAIVGAAVGITWVFSLL
jgi:pheromone shutdown-related protein TraB